MAGQDHVDARHEGEMEGRVLVLALRRRRRDAGMGERHDQVGAALAHLRHPGARRLDDVARVDLAPEM